MMMTETQRAELGEPAVHHLCNVYDVEPEDIRIDGMAIYISPNTNETGEFFAGYIGNIQDEAQRDD